MKKFLCLCMGILMSASVFAFAACGQSAMPATPAGESPSLGTDGTDASGNAPSLPQDGGQNVPEASPLAALDSIEISRAFGDTGESGWSFALSSAGTTGATSSFKWISEISGREKFYSELGFEAGLDDKFGLRKGDGATGVDLFGGGNASLALKYTGPKSDSEPLEKTLNAGFEHDGEFILYAGADGEEKQVTLGEIKEKLNTLTQNEALAQIAEAALTVPEGVKKGLSLRLSVEKLTELGFTVEIDDSDGLAVKLIAEKAFFTYLLNDLLEEFLPEDWLPYIPRADFGYKSTDFVIALSFDGNGLFREYSVSGDISLELSLEVRDLFKCESGFTFKSAFSVCADYGTET